MPVHVLWSAPRSRSTAFFRSIVERGDFLALHEPLEGLAYIGPIEVRDQPLKDVRTFKTVTSLISWLLDSPDQPVFLKETVNVPVLDIVGSNHRFLTEVRHSFLIRRPEEIAASWYALEQDLRMEEAGIRALYELYRSVQHAGGYAPVIIDSDDLVTRPDMTMRAWCDAVELPFIARALTWDAGARVEWERTSRWHVDASMSTRFTPPQVADRHSLETHPDVVRFALNHRPFYERLLQNKLHIPGD